MGCIKRFIRFHGNRHPLTLAAPAQNQAKSALLFLCKEALDFDLLLLGDIQSARAPRRMPVVVTRMQVLRVFDTPTSARR